jgi:hypothetical protein
MEWAVSQPRSSSGRDTKASAKPSTCAPGRKRQAQRKRDPRPNLRATERPRRGQRQGRGQGDEGGGVAFVQRNQHAAAELALLGTLRQGARQLEQGRRRHRRGQERQIVDQTGRKCGAHAGQQLVGGHAFQGRGLLIRRGGR